MTASLFARERERLASLSLGEVCGRVSQVIGLTICCRGLPAPVGSLVEFSDPGTGTGVEGEVIGFREGETRVMPFGETRGVAPGSLVRLVARTAQVGVGPTLLGRVLDGRGRPIDGKGPLYLGSSHGLYAASPAPLSRRRIDEPVVTGVRVIDALFTVGKGQRMGIFSGTGVGKSVLLGMIARFSQAGVVVLALVGERGREVREFLEKELGPEGLARSVVVVATSDAPALLRMRAPLVATAIAEYFREQGKDVLLLLDSLTRLAYALREIGLAAGEPPATKGYPPSMFSLFPRLLERAGRSETGSITGIYTVLVEGDDLADPVADTVRGILDGHLWLSRDLARRAFYPAVDPLDSISRVMPDIVSPGHYRAAQTARRHLAVYREAEDLIQIGAYAKGSNPEVDEAIACRPALMQLLSQDMFERGAWPQVIEDLRLAVGLDPMGEGAADRGPAAAKTAGNVPSPAKTAGSGRGA